jgi:hypothetical protein
MKRTAIAVLLCAGIASAADPPQLLNNGSFEQASRLQWDVQLYPRHDKAALPRVFSLTDELAVDGSHAVRIDTGEAPADTSLVIVGQTFSAFALRGQRLRLSAQSMLQTERNSDGSPLVLNVRQWGAGDRVVAGRRLKFANTLGQWTTATVDFDVDPDALRIDIQLMAERNTDDVHKTVMLIDDVRLTEALPDDLTLMIGGPEVAMDNGVLPCRVNVGPHVLEAIARPAGLVKLLRDDDAVAVVAFNVENAVHSVELSLDAVEPGRYTVVVELYGGDGRSIARDARDVLLYNGPFAGE